MKYARPVLFVLFLTSGGYLAWKLLPDTGCAKVQRAEYWLDVTISTREELRAEINAVIVDNHCDGITPEKLRKVLLDMERVR